MKSLSQIHQSLFNFFLIIIPTTIIFRKPCTWLIIAFIFFSLLFYKIFSLKKEQIISILIISSPLLLEILFFWNNDSYKLGYRSLEKSLSLLFFPIIIIGNLKYVNFHKILKSYSFLMTIIMIAFFIRFIVFFPEYINKYLNGVHLWEMGYVFSNTIGIHAPALNMHLSFVCVICTYLIFYNFKEKSSFLVKLSSILLFFCSFFFVLFVNTRMALFQTIIGVLIVFFYEVIRQYNFKVAFLIFILGFTMFSGSIFLFVKQDPYMIEKYSSVTFKHIDKIGKLDEVKNPEIVVFNSLVTRLSIWKSAYELSVKNLPFGVGSSDGKKELVKYFKKTNQVFLTKYEFPTHNQYLDFLLKYGFLGLSIILLYIFYIGYLGYKTKNSIIIFFFFLFFTSNLTDDFLIRFDGIVFSGFWISVFASYKIKELNFYKEIPN